jgi:RNA polymerase sigma-70 factor, ECF subfamily
MAMTRDIGRRNGHSDRPDRHDPDAAWPVWPVRHRRARNATPSHDPVSVTAVGPHDPVSVTAVDADDAELTDPAPSTGSSPSAARAADELFIQSLYAEYAGSLLTVVGRLTGGDRHWAEDVVQETLLRAWRHADRLVPQGKSRSLMPWLVTVARRIVINDWRSRDARPREVNDDALAMVAVPDDTERALQRLIILDALGKLRPAHRRVIVEMFLHGRTVREVARIVGVPPGTVKSRVFTAIRVMRAEMHTAEGQPVTG